MVLLGSLLGDQGFQGVSKEFMVPLGTGSHNVDQQVSPGPWLAGIAPARHAFFVVQVGGENVWEGSLAGDLAGWEISVLRLGLWGESRLRIFWPPSGPMAALPLLIHRCNCDAPTAQPAPPGVVPSARTRACNSLLGSATNLPSV